MKNLSEAAKLGPNNYTNHSIRATCIGTLDEKGFEACHITTLSSHKSESTIKTYSNKCPDNKKREMYDALNDSVIPKKTKTQDTNKEVKSTINVQDLKAINSDQNTNNNNANLPNNFDLMPFEDEENDDFLLQYLRDNPQENFNEKPVQSNQVVNTTNNMSTSMPIVPKMFFQNSNITINYNFSK